MLYSTMYYEPNVDSIIIFPSRVVDHRDWTDGRSRRKEGDLRKGITIIIDR
jgi:hypothetical protein